MTLFSKLGYLPPIDQPSAFAEAYADAAPNLVPAGLLAMQGRIRTASGCPEHHADERDRNHLSKLLSRPVLHPATETSAGSNTRREADH